MRNSIILGTFLALFGLAAVAYASDRPQSGDQSGIQAASDASNDGRGESHDRYERKDRTGDRHDESRDRSRGGHDESSERHDRR